MRSRSYRADLFADSLDDDDSSDDRSQWRTLLAPPLFRRPKDLLSLCLALAATAVIVINALFLQTGPHPAPIFANLPQPVAPAELTSSTAALPRQRPAERDRSGTELATTATTSAAKPAPAGKSGIVSSPAAPPRHDSIAELLEASNLLIAAQHALAEFGYGQIKPTGILGAETKSAIEKFEREHKLPVTGQMSERLVRELTVMKGGPL